MRYIRKKPSPPAFEDWKSANNPTHWSDLQNEPSNPEEGVVYYSKNELREALLLEQGYLCCYCQQLIKNGENTIIEHLFPRNGVDKATGQARMFEYDNVLAACDGGSLDNRERLSGLPSYPQYCDKNKGEEIIFLSPLQPDIETKLTYRQTGLDEIEIIPSVETDEDAKRTIHDILNLNVPKLKNLRGKAIVGLIFQNPATGDLISVQDAKALIDAIERKIDNVENVGNEYLPEFCTVKLHFLRLFAGRT
ncbi:MAG: TIGR02646 family protein [Lewinellaceae bacterium]|nr:TIGR02646 family protein [Lewinellaceae bacterium]